MKLRKNKTGTWTCPCCHSPTKKEVKHCTKRRIRREAKKEIREFKGDNNGTITTAD